MAVAAIQSILCRRCKYQVPHHRELYVNQGRLPHFHSSICSLQLGFMRQFGYLDTGSSTSEALYHEDAIVAAIKNVQKYGALNETGELDNATLKVCVPMQFIHKRRR